MDPKTQDDLDNHANQLNPNNDEYWNSRGYDDKDVVEQENNSDDKND